MEGLSKLSKTLLLLCILVQSSLSLEEVGEMEMDSLEKDKILTCLQVVTKRFQVDSKVLEELTNPHGMLKEHVMTKISADMMSSCYNKISDDVVKSVYNNLNFVEFDWSEDLIKVSNLDYSNYRTINDLQPTPEQNILFMKIEKAKDEYLKANRERQEKASKSLPPVLGLDLNAISLEVKVLYMVIVFAIFAILIVFLLTKVLPKPKTPKPKKH